MPSHPAIRWLRIISGVMIFAFTLIFAAQALTRESVRAEPIRLQDEKGLTLAWVDNNGGGIQAVLFKERRLILGKNSLQTFAPGRFSDQCANATQRIDPRLDLTHFTSQCWSPDHKHVAYDSEGSVKVYPIGGNAPSVRVVAKGTGATWSPDGNWIAFRNRDTYYAIHPDGNGSKKLFHNHWCGAVSALYWSPDSRIVASVRELGFLQEGWLNAEVNQLRVRRLEDGSEDRLCPDNVDWYANYRWITSSEVMKHPGSESSH